jgi:hypothetical protein
MCIAECVRDFGEVLKHTRRRIWAVVEVKHDPEIKQTKSRALSGHNHASFGVRIVLSEISNRGQKLRSLVTRIAARATPDLDCLGLERVGNQAFDIPVPLEQLTK